MLRTSAIAIAGIVGAVLSAAIADGQAFRCVESTGSTFCDAALVDDVPLIHTAQLLPVDEAGQIVGSGDAPAQAAFLRTHLQAILKSGGSDLQRVVKLNAYVASREAARAFDAAFREVYQSGSQRPAYSLVHTPLPHPDVLIAIDAVAIGPAKSADSVSFQPHAAIMPAGSRIYVSGQAEPGTLREATEKTLASLSATLRHCERTDRDIVQLKCFLQPMSSVQDVREEIARHFGKERVPPVAFVEWKSSASIEIELVAWGGPASASAAGPLEFITPPGMKTSPLYSGVARIHRGGTIFFSDLASDEGRVEQPFQQLKLLLEKTGSDYQHLAKATYYVTDDEVSKAHNEVRPRYYDPLRPPAASKAMVNWWAGAPRGIYRMDMIAVPSSRGTPASGPEQGFGLTAAEAAEGWLSLFDGETTFGWTDAAVENGMLLRGMTTVEFGPCQIRGQFAGSGSMIIAGQRYPVSNDTPLEIDGTKGARDVIRSGRGTRLKSLAVRPLALQPLFNQCDLTGWQAIGRKGPIDEKESFWKLQGKNLRAVGGPGAIEYTGRQFGDAVIQLDVRTRAVHSNGGLFFRAIPGDFMNGYEAQLHNRCLEDDPAKPFRFCTGGIDDRQNAKRQVARDFTTFRITVIATGPHIATWVNGHQTVAWTDDRQPADNPREGQRLKPGALQLQAHDPATDYEVSQILAATWE